MSNDKVTNEQQAQNKSDRKKWIGYTWEAIKLVIRLADLFFKATDYFEGRDK